MSRFKVGDRVRVRFPKNTAFGDLDILTVMKIDTNLKACFCFKQGSDTEKPSKPKWFFEEELESEVKND